MTDARVLTVRQPWAWAIVHGGKDVENRSRPTRFRGSLLIHAGQAFQADGYDQVVQLTTVPPPDIGTFQHGTIIGVVDLFDCVQGSDSPWADDGYWHWLLRDPRPIEPAFPAVGKLSLWKPPAGLSW